MARPEVDMAGRRAGGTEEAAVAVAVGTSEAGMSAIPTSTVSQPG